MYAFLREISDIPSEDRQRFIADLEKNRAKLQKAGETIVQYLDLFDRIEKSEILGRLVKARVNGAIDYRTFERLSSMVVRVYLPDLEDLVRFYNKEKIESEIIDSLASVGLITAPTGGHVWSEIFVSEGFSINKYGKLLVELALVKHD